MPSKACRLWYNNREMGPQMLPPAGPGERPPEALPQINLAGGENMPQNPYERGVERQLDPDAREQKAGAGVGDGDSAAAAAIAMPTPLAPLTQADTSIVQVADDTNPLVAEDSDLIEKEWVTKSKDIQKKFRDDPHQQRSQVSALNADYLNKRFGVQVKLPQE